MAQAKPPIVSAAEWENALASLAKQEEAVAAELDQLSAARKRMPMVRVDRDYRFVGPFGEVSLRDLFEGRNQLILYRFFFEEGVDGWPDAGCVGCSSWADGVADLNLLHARDITFAMASPAPQPSLRAYAERMGWTDLPWYTIESEVLHRGLRRAGVVRAQHLPARRGRGVPDLLPAERDDGEPYRQRQQPGGTDAVRRSDRG